MDAPALIRITCYVRPHRLEAVKSAIADTGVTGMNVADVRGTGNSPETSRWGGAAVVAMPIRSRIEVVAEASLQEEIIQAILSAAQTGESGDGKIFVEPVEDVLRVRTGERGQAAL